LFQKLFDPNFVQTFVYKLFPKTFFKNFFEKISPNFFYENCGEILTTQKPFYKKKQSLGDLHESKLTKSIKPNTKGRSQICLESN
jgi:hypothetical protein